MIMPRQNSPVPIEIVLFREMWSLSRPARKPDRAEKVRTTD